MSTRDKLILLCIYVKSEDIHTYLEIAACKFLEWADHLKFSTFILPMFCELWSEGHKNN